MFYSQHVLGIGHFFRSMELAGALNRHEVLFVEGGDALPGYVPPAHVKRLLLPPLMMDPEFKSILTHGRDAEGVRAERQHILLDSFLSFRPDVLITELFPFGRKQFRFELMPILERIRKEGIPTKVICSLRDILVEKKDRKAYEEGVIEVLNPFYDHLMVHSDPRIMPLDETFERVKDITVPMDYTGFIARRRVVVHRASRGRIIVASTGGGNVGGELLEATVSAMKLLPDPEVQLRVFIGPFMEAGRKEKLKVLAAGDGRIRLEPFSLDFFNELSNSDLSVSMAGYNTCMDILCTGVRALVYPFPQNREQAMRARKFEELGFLNVLSDLRVKVLAETVGGTLRGGPVSSPLITPDLRGAAKAAVIVEKYCPRD